MLGEGSSSKLVQSSTWTAPAATSAGQRAPPCLTRLLSAAAALVRVFASGLPVSCTRAGMAARSSGPSASVQKAAHTSTRGSGPAACIEHWAVPVHQSTQLARNAGALAVAVQACHMPRRLRQTEATVHTHHNKGSRHAGRALGRTNVAHSKAGGLVRGRVSICQAGDQRLQQPAAPDDLLRAGWPAAAACTLA